MSNFSDVNNMEHTHYPAGSWPAFDEHSRFESATQEVAQHVEVAPEMARTAALSAMAVACQGVVDVAYPNGHIVPTSLYLLTIAETGERKTALENWFFDPIKHLQKAKKEESDQEHIAYQRRLKNWQTGEKVLAKKFAKAFADGEPTEEIERWQAEHDANKPKPPRRYQLIYENVTPIALAYGLYDNLPVACLVSSEAGTILEGKAVEDLPMLNALWSGSSHDVTRRTSPDFTLSETRLTIALMAQPKVIERFLEKRGDEAMGNGFLSRLLVIKPESKIGQRDGKGRAVDATIMARFNERVNELLDASLDIVERGGQRRVLQLTASAKQRWATIYWEIEKAQQEHGLYQHARGHASKLMENITRVAAIIHTFEGYEGDIDTPTLEYARQLCNDYSQHFLKYIAGDPEIVTLTNQLVRDIRHLGNEHHDGTRHFKKAVIRQYGRSRRIRESKYLNAAIKLLMQLGHLEEVSSGNFRFSETIIGAIDPHFKNGVDYYVEEILKYGDQEYYSEKGRYAGFKQKPHLTQTHSLDRSNDFEMIWPSTHPSKG